jgi:hypothetical protein
MIGSMMHAVTEVTDNGWQEQPGSGPQSLGGVAQGACRGGGFDG